MKCPSCHKEISETVRFCPYCGDEIQAKVGKINRRRGLLWLLIIILGVTVLLTAAAAAYLLFIRPSGGEEEIVLESSPVPTITPIEPAATLPPVVTKEIIDESGESAETTLVMLDSGELASPLADVDFPANAIEYPTEWPDELRYPDSFELVDTRSGSMPGGESQGWSVKLRYLGNPKKAGDELANYFTGEGWRVVERFEYDSGAVILLLERNGRQDTGIVLIDADPTDADQTNVMSTLFP